MANIWHVLDLVEDPTPGDPGHFREMATRLLREAEHADQRTERLRQVAAHGDGLRMQGDYAPRFRRALTALPGQSVPLGSAQQACANALTQFADQLHQAKLQSAAALNIGRQADAQYRAALRQFYALVPVAPPATGIWRGLNQLTALAYSQHQRPHIREAAARIGAHAEQAEQERQRAIRLARQADQTLRAAEGQCARAIRAAAPQSKAQPIGAGASAPGGRATQAPVHGSPHLGHTGSSARAAVSAPRINGRPPQSRKHRGDPVDVATGHVTLTQTDVDLPGSLPLLFSRTHDSSFRAGRWMGPSWICTADQRLEIDAEGVVLVGADGVLLAYPHPEPGVPVLPVTGARRPLTIDAHGTYTATDPDTGLLTTFVVEPHNPGLAQIAEVRDRAGRCIVYDHDDLGTPLAIRHSSGRQIQIEVQGDRITALSLASAGPGSADRQLMRFGYTDGHLTDVINSSGQPVRFAYDHEGRMLSWTDRNGSQYAYRYDHLDRCVEQGGAEGHLAYRYAYDGREPETGHRITAVTDSQGHTTRYTINTALQIVTETDPLGHTSHFVRDNHDQLLSHTDPLSHTTAFTYDGAGNLTSITYPDDTRTLVTPGPFGLPTSVTTPDGTTWHQTYDAHGQCTSFTDPTGATTHYTYDEHGHLATAIDALGNTTRIQCDTAGLAVRITDPLGAVTRITYDAFGRTSTVTDPLGHTSRLTWTPEGLVASLTGPDGATESWTYDGEGNRVAYTDVAGRITRFTYGAFDQLSSVTTPDGARQEFAHDTELRLIRVTNALGRDWVYDYDAAGRLVSETDFDGRTIGYAYNPLGQLTSRTNALGQTATFGYDDAGRQVARDADGRTTHYTYDAAGRILTAAGTDATLTYAYDPVGRVTAESVDGRSLITEYDALGRRRRRTTPAGSMTAYDYDAAGNRTALTVDGHVLASSYDALGREVTRRISQGLTLTHVWDQHDRLAGQTLTGPADRRVVHRTFAYGTDGHVVAVDDRRTGRRTFDLDPSGHVTAVRADGWTETYTYDSAGNTTHADWPERHLLPEARGARSFEGGRVTRAGAVRYDYDAAGRVVQRRHKRLSRKPDVWRYTWDADDRLTAVTTPDGTVWRYLYDAVGRRVAKQRLAADGDTVVEETRFCWDGPHLVEQITHVLGESEDVVLTWEHDEMRPVAQSRRSIVAETPQNAVDEQFFAIVTDLVGTPVELVALSGEIAWRGHATLWGLTAPGTDAAADTPLRFPGQYFDPETQLHYNCFRHYDPTTAAYVSPDPLGLDAGPNPRAYVSNPLKWVDYLGLVQCSKILGKNMAREGRPVGPGQAAAHIVPSGFKRGGGPAMRALLAKYNVGINDAANGIPLGHPKPHNFTHYDTFLGRLDTHLHDLVNRLEAGGAGHRAIRTALRRELRSIGRQIEGELSGWPNNLAPPHERPWTRP